MTLTSEGQTENSHIWVPTPVRKLQREKKMRCCEGIDKSRRWVESPRHTHYKQAPNFVEGTKACDEDSDVCCRWGRSEGKHTGERDVGTLPKSTSSLETDLHLECEPVRRVEDVQNTLQDEFLNTAQRDPWKKKSRWTLLKLNTSTLKIIWREQRANHGLGEIVGKRVSKIDLYSTCGEKLNTVKTHKEDTPMGKQHRKRHLRHPPRGKGELEQWGTLRCTQGMTLFLNATSIVWRLWNDRHSPSCWWSTQ